MSKRKPAPTPPPLTGEILSHRRGFERFVLEHAEPWHREHLGRLFTNWRTWNGEHFESRLEPPGCSRNPVRGRFPPQPAENDLTICD